MDEKTTWKIRVAGYGTFDFEGTEAEAEQKRKDKCRWEHATGLKWRADLSRESDKLTAEIATLFDADKGCPVGLFDRRRLALKAEALSGTPCAECGGDGETGDGSEYPKICKSCGGTGFKRVPC